MLNFFGCLFFARSLLVINLTRCCVPITINDLRLCDDDLEIHLTPLLEFCLVEQNTNKIL